MDKVSETHLHDLPVFAPGSVWLVGAGPGDPGLLTLLALHALKSCDVVVYDALVDARILDFANAAALRVPAGKRGGQPSPKQPDITAQLIELAKSNKRVLRLKGGDPFMFGRGAEEALALSKAHVPFRVVPGITAGIGGLAYAGIPTTTRDTNSAVTFITGHSATGALPDALDWNALARGAPVLVFYMAMRHLNEIAAKLLDAGRSANEPAAVVARAATPDQQVVQTTLGALSSIALPEPPAILVVGEVVDLRRHLAWWQP